MAVALQHLAAQGSEVVQFLAGEVLEDHSKQVEGQALRPQWPVHCSTAFLASPAAANAVSSYPHWVGLQL